MNSGLSPELSSTPPLLCLDQAPESTTFAVPCEGCPLISTEAGCAALTGAQVIRSQGREIARLTEENQRTQEINAILLERLLNLRIDALVGTAFTPEGLRDHLTHDEQIQEELRKRNWGAVRLDGRFVHYINRFGTEVGDDFLQSGGEEITSISDGLVRVRPDRRQQQKPVEVDQRVEEQRQQGHSLKFDIICRQGGDEFVLLIRNVDPAQLARIAARIQAQLSVAVALERYNEGKVPFIASVGFAHAMSPEFGPEVTGMLSRQDYWEAFRKVSAAADVGQRAAKSRQYNTMWELTVASMPPNERPITVTRPGDREVAETFLRIMCPDFMDDPMSFLVRQRESDDS